MAYFQFWHEIFGSNNFRWYKIVKYSSSIESNEEVIDAIF